MSRYTPRQSTEFEARQLCFEFGDACRFVAALVTNVKKALTGYVRALFNKIETPQKAEQLNLELT